MGGNVLFLKTLTDIGTYVGPRVFLSRPMIGQTSGHSAFRPGTAVAAERDSPLTYM